MCYIGAYTKIGLGELAMSRRLSDESISARNYYLMIAEGSVFWFASSFIDGNSVISVFINEATGSIQLAGLTATLRSCVVIVGQFLIGMWIYRIRNFDSAMHWFAFLTRPLLLLSVPLLLLGVSGTAAAVAVIVLLCLFYFSDGFVGLLWTELGARTIPPRKRASIQGYQQVFGGIAGLLSAVLVKAILDSPRLDFHQRYAIIFGLCGLVFASNAVVLYFIKDLPRNRGRKVNAGQASVRSYLGNFLRLWRADGNCRNLMRCRVLYVLATMGSSLLVLFGKGYAGLTDVQASAMLYLQVGGQVIGGFLWAQLCRRKGNNFQIMFSFGVPLAIALLGAFTHFAGKTGINLVGSIGAMVLLSGMYTSAWIGIANRVIDIVEPAERTNYLVMQSLLQFPFTFAAYFAGLAAELWSFLPVFAAIGLCGLTGFGLSAKLYRERDRIEAKVETSKGA